MSTASMKTCRWLIVIHLVGLAISTALHAQYGFRITHADTVGSLSYGFFSVDCSADVCTAAGLTIDYAKQSAAVTFFRSTDGGSTWTDQNAGLTSIKNGWTEIEIGRVQQIDGRHAIVIGELPYNPGTDGHRIILSTSDGGLTWGHQLDTALSSAFVSSWPIHFSDSLTGIFTWFQKLFITHDGGANWTQAPFKPRNQYYGCHSDGGNRFRAWTSWASNVIYSTSDDWRTVDSSREFLPQPIGHLGDTSVEYLEFRGLDTVVGAATVQDTMHEPYPSHLQLFKSTDGGYIWTRTEFPDTIIGVYPSMSSLGGSNSFMGGAAAIPWKSIIVSTDHGMSWQIDTLIPEDNIYPPRWSYYIPSVATTSDGHGVAVMESSPGALVYSYLARIDKWTNSVVEPRYPATFGIRLFPDPATDALSIMFEGISSPIHLCDLLGREVPCGVSSSDGKLTLEVSRLPRGIYAVMIERDGKMVPAGKVALIAK